MANVKITELGALASAASGDLVPVVDVTDDTTKKATAGQIVSVISGDVGVADDGTATISELPVSKLQDGAARQLLQTDAAGFGVEWTSNVDVPGTLDVTGATTLDSTLTVPLGSAASPTLRFSGDANTGVYSPGADQVAISTGGTGRLFVDASGNINIDSGGVYYDAVNNRLAVGTTTPQAPLSISNGGANGIEIYSDYTGLGQSGITSYNRSTSQRTDLYISTDETIFLTSGSERARIDSSGRLLVGTSTALADASTVSRSLQIAGINAATSGQFIARFENGPNASAFVLGKSRGATVGTYTVVNSGDQIGRIAFDATDGTKFVNSALIAAEVDGTPGTNDMPGRLVFSTTADGASSPTERMRIKSSGIINFSNTPVYADNAAATTGGLAIGDVYRTSTGQLMIRY